MVRNGRERKKGCRREGRDEREGVRRNGKEWNRKKQAWKR